VITGATSVAAGTLTIAGKPIGQHCLVTGQLQRRTSPVDGKAYAIGFEMRLPLELERPLLLPGQRRRRRQRRQATGPVGGGGPLDNALNLGFAVISSDAGHQAPTPFFGIDPQARLDYGYQAVGKLTPMAKNIIQAAYGKGRTAPTSAAARTAGATRWSRRRATPTSTTASWSGTRATACRWRRSPTSPAARPMPRWPPRRATWHRLHPGRTRAGVERGAGQMRCARRRRRRPGAGHRACQKAFDLNRDVPTCSGTRDGTCLSAAQKTGIAAPVRRRQDRKRRHHLHQLPVGCGPGHERLGEWKFSAPIDRDSGAVAFIWSVPPEDRATFNGRDFVLNANLDACWPASTPPARRIRRTHVLHDAAEPEQPVHAEEPRRQDDGLSRHQRPDLLERRHHRWYERCARQRIRRLELRALLPLCRA
jgi:hypothetical protein